MDNALLDIPLYVRLISGMVLGLSVSRLLTGIAKMAQKPTLNLSSLVQLLWAFTAFVGIAGFWWEEARTFGQVEWTYGLYIFQIVYCGTYLIICAMIFPDDTDEFPRHLDFLLARRFWFYGAFLVSFVLGIVDVYHKIAPERFWAYLSSGVLNMLLLAALIVALIFKRRAVHVAVAIFVAGLSGYSLLLGVI